MVSLKKRMFKLTTLLALRTGPGAAILPPSITRLTLSFNTKCNDGHIGPRHFWRAHLPRLKYHNPGVPMDVRRADGAPGPATLVVESGEEREVLDVRHKSADAIWEEFVRCSGARVVEASPEERAQLEEVERERVRREADREKVRKVVEAQRRERELLRAAREGGVV